MYNQQKPFMFVPVEDCLNVKKERYDRSFIHSSHCVRVPTPYSAMSYGCIGRNEEEGGGKRRI